MASGVVAAVGALVVAAWHPERIKLAMTIVTSRVECRFFTIPLLYL